MCLLPGMHVNVNPPPSPAAQGWEGTSGAGMDFTEQHVCCTYWCGERLCVCLEGQSHGCTQQLLLLRSSWSDQPLVCNSGFWGCPHSLHPPIAAVTHLDLDEWSQCKGKVCFLCLSFPICRMAWYHPLEMSYMPWLTHSVNCFEILGWWGDKGKLLQFVLLIR